MAERFDIKFEVKNPDAAKEVTDSARAAMQEAINKITAEFEKAAKEEVPVQTGNLRDSLKAQVLDDFAFSIFSDVEYAGAVYNGEGNREPNKFIDRAFDRVSGQIQELMDKALSEA